MEETQTRTIQQRTEGYMIVGLGNPEEKYRGTRHNAGYMTVQPVDGIAGMPTLWKNIDNARVYDDGFFVMVHPLTGMNDSGEAVAALAQRYGFGPERILVVHDDISLPLGTWKMKRRGGAGGHNGIKSIIAALGTEDFPRFKIGIGKPPEGTPLLDWVLGRFTEEELEVLETAVHAFTGILAALTVRGFRGIF